MSRGQGCCYKSYKAQNSTHKKSMVPKAWWEDRDLKKKSLRRYLCILCCLSDKCYSPEWMGDGWVENSKTLPHAWRITYHPVFFFLKYLFLKSYALKFRLLEYLSTWVLRPMSSDWWIYILLHNWERKVLSQPPSRIPLCHPLAINPFPTINPCQPLVPSIFPIVLVFYRMSCEWNHTVYSFMGLASFT